MTSQTLIPLDVTAISMGYGLASKIATKDDHLWDKTILDTIVKHLLQSKKGLRMIKPYIGKEEKVQFWELVPYSCCKFRLEVRSVLNSGCEGNKTNILQ
jgi:hypothetical protein